MKHNMTSDAPGRAQQRGVSLLFALLALIALLLSTLALVRNVDTGALMMGNLGFKQDATVAADQATRQAIDWLTANKFDLNSDKVNQGYFASNLEYQADGSTARPPVDPTGRMLDGASRRLIDWDKDGCRGFASGSYTDCSIVPVDGTDVGGNKVRYIIMRLCSKVGDHLTDTTVQCAKVSGTGGSAAANHGEIRYGAAGDDEPSATPYFRILVRVAGARNTTSFTETLVHF